MKGKKSRQNYWITLYCYCFDPIIRIQCIFCALIYNNIRPFFDYPWFDDTKCLHRPVLNDFACCYADERDTNKTTRNTKMGTNENFTSIYQNKCSSKIWIRSMLWKNDFSFRIYGKIDRKIEYSELYTNEFCWRILESTTFFETEFDFFSKKLLILANNAQHFVFFSLEITVFIIQITLGLS